MIFSPDSLFFASSSRDGTIRIWRTETGECIAILGDHSSNIRSMQFAGGSDMLISTSADRTINVWHVQTGNCLRTWETHQKIAHLVLLSDGSMRFASLSQESKVQIWQVETGECLMRFQGKGCISSIALSPNAALIALSYDEGEIVEIRHTDSADIIHSFRNLRMLARLFLAPNENKKQAAVFSHDSTLVLAHCSDLKARIWRVNTGECLLVFEDANWWYRSFAFSHDPAIMASNYHNDNICIWSTETGECIDTLCDYANDVTSMALSPDADFVVSGSTNGSVSLLKVDVSGRAQQFSDNRRHSTSLAISHDGALVAHSSRDGTLCVWSTRTGECLHTLSGHDDAVISTAFSHDSTLLVGGAYDCKVHIWSTETGEHISVFEGHSTPVTSVTFSGNSDFFASVARVSSTVRVWRVSTKECCAEYAELSDARLMATFLQESLLIASLGKCLQFWLLKPGDELEQNRHVFSVPCYYAHSAAFSEDLNLVASAREGTVKIWSVTTGRCLRRIETGLGFTKLRFRYNPLGLETNVGVFLLDDLDSSEQASEEHVSTRPSGYGVSVDRDWVTLGGENLLWLPAEYRASHFHVLDLTVVLGCVSGKLAILDFGKHGGVADISEVQ